MLDLKTYTRQELIELFKTDRLDSIKAKLKRQGYEFETSGRGAGVTLTITKLPLEFRNFCINELGFAPQTNFKKLKPFLYKFIFDENFRQLPVTAMERELEEEYRVCYQTIERWLGTLMGQDMIVRAKNEYNYFAHGRDYDGSLVTFPIDKQTYCDAWKAYWENREYGYNEAMNNLLAIAKGTPQKLEKIIENAFGGKKMDKLKEILQKEINIDE